MTLIARAMTADDAPACVEIINHIIDMGGSTAHSRPFDRDKMLQRYFADPVVPNVVLDDQRLVGFQSVFDIGNNVGSIGSFTDRRNPVRGAGRVMFAKTLDDCRRLGMTAILAKITMDNIGGMAFYDTMGFRDWTVEPQVLTRPDGTKVDRIVKRLTL